MQILFLGTEADRAFLPRFREALRLINGSIKCTFSLYQHEFISEIVGQYTKTGTTHIVTTQQNLIPLLCDTASSKEQTLDNYAGSWVTHSSGVEFLFVHPLAQCVTVAYGQFLLERFLSKWLKPEKWVTQDQFTWELVESQETYSKCLTTVQLSIATAVDIETRPDLSISSIAYTCVLQDGVNKFITRTFVIPLPYGLSVDEYYIRFGWIARLNTTDTPKILQNGKYDAAYLQRFNCPLVGYMWDTQLMHHAWYAELPKALDLLAVFYVRKSVFWKFEGDSGNLLDLYRYNALDTWHTAWVFIQWIAESPQWAKNNYLLSFQTVAPNFLMESTGLLRDDIAFNEVEAEWKIKKEHALSDLKRSVGNPNYNPGSSQQNLKLLKILGCSDVRAADKKVMNRVKHRHPFIALIVDKILKYKRAEKLVGTYLNIDKHFGNRILYSLNPTTDTSRNKSKSHHFWCGFNIQNIPRSDGIKRYMIPDKGFLLYEVDYEQAESRDTGYITGDKVLIEAVDSDRDFHKNNATLFFGIPYEEVDKELRQLSKPINHGANYMMAEDTLIDSMGLENVFKAQSRLGLPKFWAPKQVTKHLLSLFAKAYPVVAKEYPNWIKAEVKSKKMLVNPYGWTRYCFGDPIKNKAYLRSLVAHPSQSTNAQALNKAVRLIFDNVWKKHSDNFKMNAQIHDSVLHQIREGHEYLKELVADQMLMASTVEVKDIYGITRTLKVPVAMSNGGKSWFDSKD